VISTLSMTKSGEAAVDETGEDDGEAVGDTSVDGIDELTVGGLGAAEVVVAEPLHPESSTPAVASATHTATGRTAAAPLVWTHRTTGSHN
jgi:hypothetical protein